MKYRISDVFDLQMGKTPDRNKAEYWNDGTEPWISIADMSKADIYIGSTKECISNLAVENSGIKIIPRNTVIMSFKLSIGKVAITERDMYSNEAIMAFIDKGVVRIIPEYLYYSLLSKDWNEGTNKAVMGKTLNKATLSQMKIVIHGFDEQRMITDKLHRLGDVIAQRREQLELLDTLIKARFVEMFGDPLIDTSKWKMSTIGDQFKVMSGGTPATEEKSYWDNGTIPWIGSNMCQNRILLENDGKFITEEGFAHSSAKWFYKGTVLVALVGATIGKTALLRFDTTTNQNIAAIDVNGNDAFASEFIFYHMQMLFSKFMEIGSGKFKMANQGFIRHLPLICPPLEIQEQFAAFVFEVDKSKFYKEARAALVWHTDNKRQEWMICQTLSS